MALGTSAYVQGGADGDKISISRPNSIVFGTGLNYPSIFLNRPDKYGYFNIGNIGFGDSDTVGSDLLVAAGVDGTFATSGGWTLGGADWTISGGKANHAATGANTLYTTSAITGFTVGKMYVLTYTISSRTAGLLTPSIMGITFNNQDSNKTVSEIFIANVTAGTLTFTPSASGVYSLDDVTIKEITAGNLSIGGDFYTNNINIFNGKNIILDTATGTKIGTATTQKLGFWNATPIVQPANTVALNDVLVNTGLRATGGYSTFTTNVGVGTTSPASVLEVGGSTANVTFDGYLNCTGFTSNANGLLGCTPSDERMKQNIVSLSDTSGLAAINALNPVSFNWKDTSLGAGRQFGLVAQQVENVFPNLVQTTNPTELTPYGTKTVNYYGLIAPIVKAIQELSTKFDAEDMRVTSLEARVAALENGSISAASGSPVTFSTTSLASALNSFGILVQNGIAQFNTLVFHEIIASPDVNGASSAGSMTILAGNTVAQVDNSLVKPSTKIFITFNAHVTGSWWVRDKATGSFRVALSASQSDDVSFDYFLVQTEGSSSGDLISTTTATNTVPTATSTPPSPPPVATSTSPSADTTQPVVALIGEAAMQITIGDTFTDPGATATDDTDGSLTAAIVETGEVDVATTGLYTLTYLATDAAGNVGTVSRVVTVTSPQLPSLMPDSATLPVDIAAPDSATLPVEIAAPDSSSVPAS